MGRAKLSMVSTEPKRREEDEMKTATFNTKKVSRSHRLMKVLNLHAQNKLDNFTSALSHYTQTDRDILKRWEDWFQYKNVPFATVDYGSFSMIWKERVA